jgi:hypothetical protein
VSGCTAKPFILAKDNCRIGAKIIRDNKILRDHCPRRAWFLE